MSGETILQRYPITHLTPAARRWLAEAESPRILHVFERSCNLIEASGRLFSLVLDWAAVGPFAALMDTKATQDWPGFLEQVTAADQVRVQEREVQLGSLHVDAGQAQIWDPSPGWDHLRDVTWHISEAVPILERLLNLHGPPGSLAPLLLLVQGQHTPAENLGTARLLKTAAEPARRLLAALPGPDVHACKEAASQLAGLGAGLTPSGDDFLVGVMHAQWAAAPPELIGPLAEAITAAAAPRTTRLSAAWLHAAARGEAGWPWHALFQVLPSGSRSDLETAARRLVSIGHTSGADALTGFLLGWKAVHSPMRANADG